MKHVFIVSGEASGDVYGAQLVNALKQMDSTITVAGLGGDRMAETGMIFLYNLVKEFSVMGFIPVVLGIPKVMRFLEIILNYFDTTPPDVLVLIDYPGFNMYLATHAKKRGIRIVYYITPQIWAWAPWRIRKIKRLMDKMLVIFPFEVPFYEQANVPVEYVGHPILDRISTFRMNPKFSLQYGISEKSNVLAVVPGSRKSIIQRNLPLMLWIAQKIAEKRELTHILLPLATDRYLPLVKEIWEHYPCKNRLPELTIIQKQTYDVMCASRLALVTSGTATLETALLKTPMVVMYNVPKIYKWLFQHTSLLQCRYFALPNIISGKKIVPEHLVCEKDPTYLLDDTFPIWDDSETRQQCLEDLARMKALLGETGAPLRAATAILRMLE